MPTPTLSRGRTIWYLSIIAFGCVFIYLIAVRDMRFVLVPTKSMIPTIAPKEYLVAMNAPEYQRGDIVVVDDPQAPGEYLVKRIVAVADDVVDIRAGALFIDGAYISEPYLNEPIAYALPYPYRVKKDEVFVLGDNRNWSIDSHNWNENPEALPLTEGVPLESVLGRVRYVYLPLKNARAIKPYPLSSVASLK